MEFLCMHSDLIPGRLSSIDATALAPWLLKSVFAMLRFSIGSLLLEIWTVRSVMPVSDRLFFETLIVRSLVVTVLRLWSAISCCGRRFVAWRFRLVRFGTCASCKGWYSTL